MGSLVLAGNFGAEDVDHAFHDTTNTRATTDTIHTGTRGATFLSFGPASLHPRRPACIVQEVH
jgi:hypothetical protein